MISGRSRWGRGSAAVPSFPPEAARLRARSHWRATQGLMLTTVAAWAACAFGLAPIVDRFSAISRGSPSAALLSGTGIPVIFMILVFVFANSQRAIDRVFRVSDVD